MFLELAFKLFAFIGLAWARGGGAGGGHGGGGGGGSGGGGDIFGLIFDLIFIFGPVPGVIFIIVVIVIFYLNRKKVSTNFGDGYDNNRENRVFRSVQTPLQVDQITTLNQKVQLAFLTVQDCWSHKNLSKMRRFISDGVYQRFNAQFTMMNILGQSNPVTGVEIRGLKIVGYSVEGAFEHVDIAICAYADDQFLCERYPILNSAGGAEEFQEVWSFIRRRDYMKSADIYHSLNCPKCGGNLTGKLQEDARCSFCGVYLNDGYFDWVLSEIYQEEDYDSDSPLARIQSTDLPEIIQQVEKIYPAFSTHVLEDHASNAYMQILIGMSNRKMDMVKRFTTPAAFEKIKRLMVDDHIAYNRLYIADTRVISIEGHGNTLRAHVGVEYYSQIVLLNGDKVKLLDSEEVGSVRIVTFVRELTGAVAKGNVFANSCPSCGAAQKDSLSVKCEYCGASLNDPKLDWVAEDIQTIEEYGKAELAN